MASCTYIKSSSIPTYSKSFDSNGSGGGGGGGQKEVVFGGMGSRTKDAAVLDKSRLRMKVQREHGSTSVILKHITCTMYLYLCILQLKSPYTVCACISNCCCFAHAHVALYSGASD